MQTHTRTSVSRFLSALLVACMLLCALPVQAEAAEVYTDELSAAQKLAAILPLGMTQLHMTVPSNFDYTLCYRYLSMLYRDAYVFEYISNRASSYINIVYNDTEKHQMAEAEAARLAKELIREDMSERERYRAIYRWLLTHCEYDMHAALNQATETGDAFAAYGALLDGLAVCDGISAAFAMICRHADLPCIYVASSEMNHSWNAVWFDGEIRYIDATYDLTSGQEDHFLLTAEELAADHTWDQEIVRTVTDTLWDMRYISAYTLNRIGGLFRGSDKGWELDRQPTRAEAAIMLVRFLGKEQEALRDYEKMHMPFLDVNPNHAPYIAALYALGLTRGTGETTFSPNVPVSARDYMTFMLRALGYREEQGDFAWATAVEDSRDLNVLNRAEYGEMQGRTFDRGMMAFASLRALRSETAAGEPLWELLLEVGILSEKKLKEFLK